MYPTLCCTVLFIIISLQIGRDWLNSLERPTTVILSFALLLLEIYSHSWIISLWTSSFRIDSSSLIVYKVISFFYLCLVLDVLKLTVHWEVLRKSLLWIFNIQMIIYFLLRLYSSHLQAGLPAVIINPSSSDWVLETF